MSVHYAFLENLEKLLKTLSYFFKLPGYLFSDYGVSESICNS
jgi:hypothetical protein